MNGRYYDSEIGQFLIPDYSSLDPYSIGGLNPYSLESAFGVSNPLQIPPNCDNISTSIPLVSDGENSSGSGWKMPGWLGWAVSGVQFALGIGLCFVPGAQGLGVALLASGSLELASNTMTAAGVSSQTASLISSGAHIALGIGLLFSPFAPVGASMIGAGIGSIGGGYISQALGGSFELGAMIGGFVGGIAGGKIYDHIVFSKIAAQGVLIGKDGAFQAEAAARGLAYYKGMPGYAKVKGFLGERLTGQLGWANNYRYISNVMRYGGSIYSLGGVGGSYAKEIALIGNYAFLYWI